MGIDDKLQQGEGRLEQAAGDLMGDEEMQEEGEQTEARGKLSEKLTDVREKIDDTIEAARDKIKQG